MWIRISASAMNTLVSLSRNVILFSLKLNGPKCNTSNFIFIRRFVKQQLSWFIYRNSQIWWKVIGKKWCSESFKTLKSSKLTKLEKLSRQLSCLLWTIFFWTCCLIRSKFQWNLILLTGLRMLLLRVLLNDLWAFIQIFFWFPDIFRVRVIFPLN